ncbi:uncharacterized protein N7473_011086 [Penicillium subrubescens]|uniref:Azaphilone pigments biosynthesis cluster protein L N-terminal domain-containing protein n=1 Tax=Penicillium subrubescens TaxID=1316194 RepID=A0A1Q5UCU4_9EURO|nr:uncharacterized protein N7473_011086 [Penicillium subrubescens]KAJ5882824.1 hypothetical protein N7473_011086 [Penicillium subrubescens]OKP10279.1 hypothetical protein PENSUB_4299 [Penicillium subrubescens]
METSGPPIDIMRPINFALQETSTLHNIIKEMAKPPFRVRTLGNELESLDKVLHSLRKTASTVTKIDVSQLSLPLDDCGKACETFQQEFTIRQADRGINRTSGLDWDNLRFTLGTIDNFTQLLNGYKSTFKIAIEIANFYKANEIASNFNAKLIYAVLDDLQDLSKNITQKSPLASNKSAHSATSIYNQIRRETMSVLVCINYCGHLLELVNRGGIWLTDSSSAPQLVAKPTKPDVPSLIVSLSNYSAYRVAVSTTGYPIRGIIGGDTSGRKLQVAGHVSDQTLRDISQAWARSQQIHDETTTSGGEGVNGLVGYDMQRDSSA